jgi:hypothetical protein
LKIEDFKLKHSALIINPWVTDFKLYDEWMHPLGLYFLMSLLRHNGWEISYINCVTRPGNARPKKFATGPFAATAIARPVLFESIPRRYKRYGMPIADFTQALKSAPRPDVIWVGSGMTYWIDGLAEAIETIEAALPGIPIIVGGISAILMPAYLQQRFPRVSVFRHSLFAGTTPFAGFHPLVSTITTTGWQPTLRDAYDYLGKAIHGPLLATLGCPLRCTYCASSILQPRFTPRDPALIVDEALYLIERFGVRDFAFFDDALLYRADDLLIPLLQMWRKRIPAARLHSPNGLHLRYLNPAVVDTLVSAGCTTFRFGYETGLEQYQQDTNRKIGRHGIADAIDLLSKAGVPGRNIGIYVMAGLPGQDPAMVHEEVDFIGSLGVLVKPVFLSPVPGTPVFKNYCREFPQLERDPLFQNDTFFTTQLPGWSWEAVDEIMARAKEVSRTLPGDQVTTSFD